MNFPEFCKGMKKHFGIVQNVGHFLDPLFSVRLIVVLDLFKFDEWLHEKHGNYEATHKLSMKGIIEKEYGEEALTWSMKALGIK